MPNNAPVPKCVRPYFVHSLLKFYVAVWFVGWAKAVTSHWSSYWRQTRGFVLPRVTLSLLPWKRNLVSLDCREAHTNMLIWIDVHMCTQTYSVHIWLHCSCTSIHIPPPLKHAYLSPPLAISRIFKHTTDSSMNALTENTVQTQMCLWRKTERFYDSM